MTTITTDEMRPGLTIVHDPHGEAIPVTLLRLDHGTDFFGRPLLRWWSRREDTGAEGYMSYGPGGVAAVAS